jgi:thiamine-phosphate pyrophosphorylase
MKSPGFSLMVISSLDGFEHEIEQAKKMLDAGLEVFHLRKPKFSTRRLKRYLDKMGAAYHSRIVIHSHHELAARFNVRGIHLTHKHRRHEFPWRWLRLKLLMLRRPQLCITTGFHALADLREHNPRYEYVFLSPIFESISKVGYKNTFHEDSLRELLAATKYRVMALGGVDEDKIETARQMGFSGVAVLGSLWKSKDPVEKFKQLQARCRQPVTT